MLSDPLLAKSGGQISLTATAGDTSFPLIGSNSPNSRDYVYETEAGTPLIRTTRTFRTASYQMSDGRKRIVVSRRDEWYDIDNDILYPYSQLNFSFIANGAGRFSGEDAAIESNLKALTYLLTNTESTPTGVLQRLIDGEY